ncbi:MAG: acyl-CoA dehydrogenase family protein [Alphaproteobacteria bacterium]|nr:acyl-CoA dehydrogenase family protein [Alphaproteobacteria bacterium]
MSMIAKIPTTQTTDWHAAAERVAAQLAKQAAAHDADDTFVADGFRLLKQEGFFKMHVPSELGGHGAGYAELADAIRTIAAGCGSTGLAFSMHSHLVAVAAWRWRNEKAPTDGLLKRVAAEDLVLISSGGSDWLKSAGTATKVEGGYRINARKIFSSGSPMGDILMTSAVTEDPQAGPTVLHFGVPFKAEGVKVHDNWRVMGMRGTGSNDVELKDVFVADAAISGRRPQAKWHHLFHIISQQAFPLIYAAYMGVADSARAKAIEIAKKKPDDNFTTTLAGELENAHTAADIAHADMIRIAESEKPGPQTTNRTMIRRTLVAQNAIKAVERAMELAGGAAFYRELGLERAFRDVQAARFHPLQEKPQLRYTGRVALGFDIDA